MPGRTPDSLSSEREAADTFAPEDAERAESLFRELRDASRKEPGVIQFEIGRGREKPKVFALWRYIAIKRLSMLTRRASIFSAWS